MSFGMCFFAINILHQGHLFFYLFLNSQTQGDSIEGRRGHASSIVGKHLLVFGGINTNGNHLNSIFHLDISIFIYL